jgi:hypothetical protein
MVDFLGRASVAVAATRDGELVSYVHFLSGWRVDDDRKSVVCLLADAFTEGLVERLGRHGDVALTVEVIGPHECYQFKGRYLDSRPATAADRPVFEACRGRFVESVRRLFGDQFSDKSLRARFRDPSLALRFEVREIYVQTPGPAAGRRLFPPED